MELFNCRLCGGDLKIDSGDTYKCSCCGSVFVKKAEEDFGEKLKGVLGEEKFARVSAARQNLWASMHEEYVNSSSCLEYARELKSLVPSDYYANFAETANGKDDRTVSDFLNKSSKADMETYADAVLDFMIKSMTPGTLTAVCNYIDRAYPKASPEYSKYVNLYEEEAEKVESGIYELTMPRDVFVAYSSKDIDKVMELTDCLEEQGISCFISMRNLRHGRGAADNYDKALQTAIDNCKTIVFISSRNSRSLACDALRKEIPYIRKTDTDNAPAEYRAVAYEKIPYKYKKDRVEYLLDDYANTAADKIVKQFFDGVEWCKTPDEVADRVITYLTAVPETDDAPRSGNIGDEDIQKIISAVTGADKPTSSVATDSATSMAVKEKNALGQIKRLISMGGFSEAKSRIDDLEKEEQNVLGVCSAAVYYYKILIDSEVDDDEKLIEKFIASDKDPSSDGNFLLAKSCEDGQDKERILKIEETIKSRQNEIRAKKLEESKKLHFIQKARGYAVSDAGELGAADLEISSEYKGKPVTEIDVNAFKSCQTLESVRVPDTVYRICAHSFSECVNLKNVVFSKNLNFIGDFAFSSCSNLVSASIPDGVDYLGKGAFSRCKSLASVSLGSKIKSISQELFAGCASLKHIVLPDSVVGIYESAFNSCTSLADVVIPKNINFINSNAFANCYSLKSFFYRGEKKDWKKIKIPGPFGVVKGLFVTTTYTSPTYTLYYYSETHPSDNKGNYWHYDEKRNPVPW